MLRWSSLIVAVVCAGWLSAAMAEPARFPDLSKLSATQELTIVDKWSGLGDVYSLQVHLVRLESEFVGEAKLDIYGPEAHTRQVKVPAALVDALLADIASRREAPPDPPKKVSFDWSDDYPSLEIRLERQGKPPLRVFYTDQKRRFRVGRVGDAGFVLGDREGDAGLHYRHQGQLHVAYGRIREAIGFAAWLDDAYKQARSRVK